MMAEAGQPRGYAEGAQLGMGLGLGALDDRPLPARCRTRRPTRCPSTSWSTGRVALSIRRHEPVGVVSAITPYNGAIIMAFQKLVPGPAGRQLGDPAAQPAHPALVAGLRRRRRRRRHPAGRAQRRGRGGLGRRRAAHHPPGGRHGVVHRVDRRRPADPRPGGADGEAGRRSSSAASRRRSTSTTPSTCAGLGAMVVVAMTSGQACVAATRMLVPAGPQGRGASRRSARRTASLTVGDPARPGHARSARSSTPPPASGASATSRSPRSTAARSRSAAAGPPGSTGATTSSRPSSTCPTTPTRRRRTRSSGRSSASSATTTSTTPSRIANDSPYGLSAQVYGADVAAATAVARRLRAGAVNVNTVAVQRLRARRRLQAERPRPRARARGHPRVPRGQAHGDRRAEVTAMTDSTRTSTG